MSYIISKSNQIRDGEQLISNPSTYLAIISIQGWRAAYVLAGAPGLLLALLLSLADEPRNNSFRFSFVVFHF